jgi:uncharacterized membrane protein
MSDVIPVAIIVAVFLLAIALVQVLGRMIDRDADPDIAKDAGLGIAGDDDVAGRSRLGGPR